jgi:SAM-dependent methyltransferase
MNCLDVGCGGGDVSFAMARLVGPTGKVDGIDLDDTKLELARQEAARDGLRNVEFHKANVEELQIDSKYDLVYSRFLLTHLRDPAAVLRRMMHAAKPGAAIIVEDIEHSGAFSHPVSSAIEREIYLYNEVVRRRGADADIGPKLAGLFREVGLRGPRVSLAQPVFTEGEAKRVHQITLDNIWPALIAAGLATDAELAALVHELDAFAERPDTIVSFPRIFQVWARRT